jgi:hypothetical protein
MPRRYATRIGAQLDVPTHSSSPEYARVFVQREAGSRSAHLCGANSVSSSATTGAERMVETKIEALTGAA